MPKHAPPVEPPLVKGGEGRTADDLVDTSVVLTLLALGGIVVLCLIASV